MKVKDWPELMHYIREPPFKVKPGGRSNLISFVGRMAMKLSFFWFSLQSWGNRFFI